MDEVVLVEPSLEYKDDVMSFLEEVRVADEGMHWQYAGMSRLEKSNTYEEWLQEKEDEEKGINLPDGYVPSSTYLCVRVADNKVIGICNIRHELTEFLLNYGGHIGQSIRPSQRGKGYGTIQLLKALEKCSQMNINHVLLTCVENNIISAKTIKKCMGEYENTTEKKGTRYKRYWIDVEKLKNMTK